MKKLTVKEQIEKKKKQVQKAQDRLTKLSGELFQLRMDYHKNLRAENRVAKIDKLVSFFWDTSYFEKNVLPWHTKGEYCQMVDDVYSSQDIEADLANTEMSLYGNERITMGRMFDEEIKRRVSAEKAREMGEDYL